MGRGTNYLFTGKELDSTGLYFYGARYYDPEIGRFISADTIVQAPFDPQSLNRYSYCRNNPIKYIDPSGHFFFAFIAAIVIGALIGGAVAAATGGNFVNGLITGAIGGALFFLGGTVITSMQLQGLAATGVHAFAGASSGALGAVATGGDVGTSALIGGISAGAAHWMGNNVGFLKDVAGDTLGAHASNLARHSAIGAVVGGGVSAAMGGSFGRGAGQGAMTSAIGYA